MCTPWTMTWLVRWGVRDLAVKNTAFDKINDNGFNRIHSKNLSRSSQRCDKKTQLNNSMEKAKDGVPVRNRFDDSSWSFSVDENYIVLCFKEDGAFDVVNDNSKGVKCDALGGLDAKHKNSRPVNRKLKYDEDAEQVSNLNIHEKRSNANLHDTDQQEQECITPSKEDEQKEIIAMGRQQHRDSIKGASHIEEIEDHGMVSSESRDSDRSEGSTGSFAFPVLGWEWIGSPAQMPESEDGLHLQKQKMKFRSLPFQCCRF